jgi:hypothetical protein
MKSFLDDIIKSIEERIKYLEELKRKKMIKLAMG